MWLFLSFLLISSPAEVAGVRCFAPWRGSVHEYASAGYARDFLDSAEVVARVAAVRATPDRTGLGGTGPTMGVLFGSLQPVEFRRIETLKGSAPERLVVLGQVVRQHSMNDGPFPYAWPRHGGGSCWAFEYVLDSQ